MDGEPKVHRCCGFPWFAVSLGVTPESQCKGTKFSAYTQGFFEFIFDYFLSLKSGGSNTITQYHKDF